MTTVCADRVNASFFVFPSNFGVSEGADELERQVVDLEEILALSVTVRKHYDATLKSLSKASEDCAIDNWDGYGARAIDWGSCEKAIRFSKLMPINAPVPEISIDTNGEVRFEWYKGPRQVFSVTVRGNGELAYAGLFGASDTHGKEYLDDELPNAVLDNIYRVCPEGNCFAAA